MHLSTPPQSSCFRQEAVDVPKHRVTLEVEGKKKTIKLSKNFQNLDQLQAGETVDIAHN